ncbi:hypothetical protein, partial [Bacteroides heparinolyticus]|uniref:hypothetical protein n=1 Tax=Prevotella heparinolytica TaxID=28113 RepID=UPI0035A09B39
RWRSRIRKAWNKKRRRRSISCSLQMSGNVVPLPFLLYYLWNCSFIADAPKRCASAFFFA